MTGVVLNVTCQTKLLNVDRLLLSKVRCRIRIFKLEHGFGNQSKGALDG